jgi:phosphate transport system protein
LLYLIKDDDLVDSDYQKLIKEVSKWLREYKQGYENVISILLIGKYLERVADHSVNISEWVIFIATGLINIHNYFNLIIISIKCDF